MKTQQQLQLIRWLKRISAVLTITVWVYVITIFLNDPAPFSELVPYCMGSTMLIFGILTALYKGLEYWESEIDKKNRQQSNEKKTR